MGYHPQSKGNSRLHASPNGRRRDASWRVWQHTGPQLLAEGRPDERRRRVGA